MMYKVDESMQMTKLGRPVAMSSENRRKEIFAAAEQLFGEKGFERVTMSEIATAVGMSKKTLYVHFADKRELLKSLVSSSYIWSKDEVDERDIDAVLALNNCLKMLAKHVLSERHIKLCRLAIAERVGMDGLTDTFYEMGISTSRNHLIASIEKIESSRFVLKLDTNVIADMLFGATIAKPFIDLLLINKAIQFESIHQHIDQTLNVLFMD